MTNHLKSAYYNAQIATFQTLHQSMCFALVSTLHLLHWKVSPQEHLMTTRHYTYKTVSWWLNICGSTQFFWHYSNTLLPLPQYSFSVSYLYHDIWIHKKLFFFLLAFCDFSYLPFVILLGSLLYSLLHHQHIVTLLVKAIACIHLLSLRFYPLPFEFGLGP